jgi:hypothetical protein
MWNLVSIHLEIVLVLVQYRRTVCAERTIRSENHFGRLGYEAQVEACFLVRLGVVLILIQDRCTVCTERSKGSEIILDAADGTAR